MSEQLSSIVTGFLRLFHRGGNPPPPVQQPVQQPPLRQPPVQLQPPVQQPPPVQPQSPPAMTETEYEKLLGETGPEIEKVRPFGVVNDIGRKAIAAMDDALNTAALKADEDDFSAAGVALKTALTQAQIITAERNKARDAFLDAQSKLNGRIDAVRQRVGKIASPPAAITAALKGATDAQAAAKKSGDAKPETWPAAAADLEECEATVKACEAILDKADADLSEATKKLAAFGVRFDALKAKPPVGGDSIKARVAYLAQQKKLAALTTGQNGTGAAAICPAVEAALADYEAKAAPSDDAKARMASSALAAVTSLRDDELAGKSLAEKAELAFNLCANGCPTVNPGLEQLSRLYRKSPPDPLFLAARDQERAKIAEKVAAITDVTKLFDSKGKVVKKEWSKVIADPAKAQALLKQISDAQADVLGLPPIVVTTYSKAKDSTGTEMGGCVWTDGPPTIELNAHKDALSSMNEAMISILHETYHAQQDILVKRLMSGELGPDDPMYPQVLMFAINKPGLGYLPPDVNQSDYEAQPVEIDAETQGTTTANAVLLAIKGKGKKKA